MNKNVIIFVLFSVAVLSPLIYFAKASPHTHIRSIISATSREDNPYGATVYIKDYKINAYLAQTPSQFTKGLSVKNSLSPNEGMLFLFSETNIRPSFWMKNMKFAIDIIWISGNTIVQIDKNAQPEPGKPDYQLTRYTPTVPVDMVLEVTAGLSDKKSFEIGDRVDINF